MDAETDRCIQLSSGFLILAEKKLSAFIAAVDKLFGAGLDRGTGTYGRRLWNRFQIGVAGTVVVSARRGALLSGSGHRDTLNLDQCVRHVQEQLQSIAGIYWKGAHR